MHAPDHLELGNYRLDLLDAMRSKIQCQQTEIHVKANDIADPYCQSFKSFKKWTSKNPVLANAMTRN